MKVLVVVHGFPPRAQGGTELYAEACARELHDRYGDEVVVLTRDSDASRPEYEVREERRSYARIVWINNTFRRTRTFEETYRNDAIGVIAERVIDGFQPDAAHVHHLTCLSTTIVGALAARRIPCFVMLHDYWLMCHRGQLLDVDGRVCEGPGPGRSDGDDICRRCLGAAAGLGAAAFAGASVVRALERRLPESSAHRLRKTAEGIAAIASSGNDADDQARRRLEHMRAVCRGATHFFAPSRAMRDRFVQFGIPAEKISVSPYGVRSARPEGRGLHDDEHRDDGCGGPSSDRPEPSPLRIGFIGSLMISKAPHVLLDAIRMLPAGSVSVDLYGAFTPYHGDDRYRAQLKPILARDGIRVHGAVPHAEIATALSSLDVVVVPSIWPENSPFVIHEAFAAGVPVVASRIGGIPELVEDGRGGLLFSPGDPDDLAATLRRLIDEPHLLSSLRERIPPVRALEDDVAEQRAAYVAQARTASARAVPRIAAVVLNHGTPDDTFLAVRSLLASRFVTGSGVVSARRRETTPDPVTNRLDTVIVVENDDDADAEERTRRALAPVWARIVYIDAGGNRGFPGGVNVGIREALARGADRVLLINSDVLVPPDCVARLATALDETPNAGIAGPLVLSRSEPDRIASAGLSYSPRSGRMRHRGFGDPAAGSSAAPARAVDAVSGCAMLVAREVFDRIGLFDEDYFFSFEDLDFCLRAHDAGFSTVIVPAAAAYHEGGRSIGAVSPRRLYFASRNHLLLASRRGRGSGLLARSARTLSVAALNLAHAVRSRGAALPVRIAAVARGIRDYAAGRFGPDR